MVIRSDFIVTDSICVISIDNAVRGIKHGNLRELDSELESVVITPTGILFLTTLASNYFILLKTDHAHCV